MSCKYKYNNKWYTKEELKTLLFKDFDIGEEPDFFENVEPDFFESSVPDFFEVSKETYNISNLNYKTYLDNKKNILVSVNNKLKEISNKQIRDKSQNLKQEFKKYDDIKEELEIEIENLSKPSNAFENTFEYLNKDVELIRELLKEKENISNLYLAEDHLQYLQDLVNYEISPNPTLISVNKDIEEDVLEPIKNLRKVVKDELVPKLQKIKEYHILNSLKNSPRLNSLYDKEQLEEIQNNILNSKKDLSWLEKNIMTLGTSLNKEGDSDLVDVIIEEFYINHSKLQGTASDKIENLNVIKKEADKYLIKNGYKTGVLGTLPSYDLFYQKDKYGNRTGQLISKFSKDWYQIKNRVINKTNENIKKAFAANDNTAYVEALNNKINWIKNNAEFLDIRKIKSLSSKKEFEEFQEYFIEDSQYEQNLIKKIGKEEFERLLKQQESLLYDYIAKNYKGNKKISNNPFSMLSDNVAENSLQLTGYYNTYYPKDSIQGKSTNYYDNNFKKIEEVPILTKLWDSMRDSLEDINDKFTDGTTRALSTSLISQKKSFIDAISNIPFYRFDKIGKYLFQDVRDKIVDTFSSDVHFKDIDNKIQKSGVTQIDKKIDKRYSFELLKLKRLGILKPKNKIKIKEESEIAEYFIELTGSENLIELESKIGTLFIPEEVVKSYIGNNIINEEHFDLPTSINNYSRLAALYEARKKSLPLVKLLEEFYKKVLQHNGENRKDAIEKLDTWRKRNIEGQDIQNQEKWLEMGKSYSTEDKIFLEEIEKELKIVENLLKDAGESELGLLNSLKQSLENKKDNLGKVFTAAAVYDTVFTKLMYFTGLGFNYMSMIPNRAAGLAGGVLRDGIDWKEGNFYKANSFTSGILSGIKSVLSKEQKQEGKKAKLLIDRLDVVQDNTNEFDRTKKKSFVGKAANLINPFYHIELVENYNQHPQILSYLMDKNIEDIHGNIVPIFNGEELYAFNINEDGNLKLKEEFRTEDNIETWELQNNDKAALIKKDITDILIKANGDYSMLGSLFLSKKVVGRSLLVFKKWFLTQMALRFSFKDGIYIDALRNKKVRASTSAGLGLMAASGTILGPIGVLTSLLSLHGMAGYALYNKKTGKYQEGELGYASQLADGALSALRKMYGIPLNIISGKQIINTTSDYKIDKKDFDNYEFIMKELAMTLIFVQAKVLLNALNPEEPDEEERAKFYVLENVITNLIETVNIYSNPHKILQTSSPSAIANKLEMIPNLYNAIVQQNRLGDISSGAYIGQNRVFVEIKKQFTPTVFRKNWGLGAYAEKDFDRDAINDFFTSDFTKEETKNRNQRKVLKAKYKEEFMKKYKLLPKKVAEKRAEAKAQKLVDKEIPAIKRKHFTKEGKSLK